MRKVATNRFGRRVKGGDSLTSHPRRHGPLVALLAAGMSAVGCSQVVRPEQVEQAEKADIDTFLHEHLPGQPAVTVGEAYRALLVLADGEERFGDYDSRRAALEERGIVRTAWKLEREACIDRGSVAYMVCRILQIRGGVNMNLVGSLGIGDRRYAARELVYMDMMQPGAAYRYVTGGELLELMAAADDYMASHGQYQAETTDIADLVQSAGRPGSQPAD